VHEAYKDLFETLTSYRRERIERLLTWLEKTVMWHTLPASVRYHENKSGGLVRHSVRVLKTMLILRDALYPDKSCTIPDESFFIVGLFHDLGKIGGFEDGPVPRYSKTTKVGAKREFNYNQDLLHIEYQVRSIYVLARFLPLTESEQQAIHAHDGQYIVQNQGYQHKETVLTTLVQMADFWSGHVLEEGIPPNAHNIFLAHLSEVSPVK